MIRLSGLTSALAISAALPAMAEMNFNRIATLPTTANMAAGEDRARASSAEIISASEDGMMLIYSDSPLGVIGRIDITDPRAPKPLGNTPVGGEPTTAVVIGERILAGVNTSESKVKPSGMLKVLDLRTGKELAACDLGGQPDSVARAADGSFVVVAIENERDEDLNEGRLPQMPAGFVVKLPVKDGAVDCAAKQVIDVTGLAAIAPEDPEPEFIHVNDAGEIVVTLQENNHIVVIGTDGKVASHFPAGAVTLEGVDLRRDGRIDFSQTQKDRPREPDAVQWIGNDLIAVANEGDYEGGSRGWTIFDRAGKVVYDAGMDYERAVAQVGHYPDGRSRSKGAEPETVAVATFGGTPMAFVVSERASVIGVYDITDPAKPVLRQMLPSGISPEGVVAIPSRNLIATANEADLGEDGGARAHVMIYEYQNAPASYPMITSEGADELIGWGALGTLVADAEKPGMLYSASDSVYGLQPRIFAIDATQKPARITKAIDVTRGGMPAQKLDIEGITLDGKGGFWLASEGRSDKLIPHALYRTDAKGEIVDEVALPPALLAGETRFGFEGIARDGDRLWMAVQREWGDDAKGQVKLLSYDTKAKEWSAVRYPLEPKGEGWMGLSELTFHNGHAYVIERDNLIGDAAKVKKIFRVKLEDLKGAPLDGNLPLVAKEEFRDLIPDLKATGGYVVDKVEGFAVDKDGIGWVITDNDGTDGSSGETLFWSIGKVE